MIAAPLRPRRATRRLAGSAATAALAAWLFLAGCGTPGSGTAGRQTRQISGIRAVELTGNGLLSIEQTGVESLTVETDDNLLDHVSSDVVDGTLVLEVDGIINPTDAITYELTVADLEGITLTGSGNVEVTDLDADRLDISISGSGTITVAGTTAAQAVDIGGSGQYQAQELSSTTATVDISGSGTATVNVSDRLDIDIAGSGTVAYHGDPVVDQHVSGAGHVTHG
jgi:Putative auto-transporter adhesin, head GIN domain